MTIFPTFYRTSESCSETRHVWFTDAIPPTDGMKCECGKKTWAEWFRERKRAFVWGSTNSPLVESEKE